MTRQLPVIQGPRTRGDCVGGARPCPWTACRHHIAAPTREWRQPASRERNVRHTGDTCALDIADRGPQIYNAIAPLLGVSRERIRQIEQEALAKLQRRLPAVLHMDAEHLGEAWAEGEVDNDAPEGWFDGEFKRAVDRAYRRIVLGEKT